MAIKSWGFHYLDHWIRIEISFRFTGWSHARMFMDHALIAEEIGTGKSLSWTAIDQASTIKTVEARFVSQRFGFRRECECRVNGELISWESVKPLIEAIPSRGLAAPPTAVWEVPLGCLFILLLTIPVILLGIPFSMYFGLRELFYRWVGAPLRYRRLLKRGRALPWQDVSARMESEGGTILITWLCEGVIELWWTPENVNDLAPFPILTNNRPSGTSKLPIVLDLSHSFHAWCNHRYLQRENGKAWCIRPPGKLLEKAQKNPRCADFYFQKMPVVRVKTPRQNVWEGMGYFLSKCGDIAPLDILSVLAFLESKDTTLELIATHAIHHLGTDAPLDALPLLMRLLCYGPMENRYLVAITMAGMGSHGVEVLLQATLVDDPWVAGEAKAGLEYSNHLGSDNQP